MIFFTTFQMICSPFSLEYKWLPLEGQTYLFFTVFADIEPSHGETLEDRAPTKFSTHNRWRGLWLCSLNQPLLSEGN